MKKTGFTILIMVTAFLSYSQTVSLYCGQPDSADHNPLGTTRLLGYLNRPWGLAYDSKNNLWISNSGGHTISVILSDGNSLYTRAGNYGHGCFSNQNGVNARFGNPSGIDVGPGDTIFVADYNNHVIRYITPFTSLGNVQAVGVKAGMYSYNHPTDPCYTSYQGYADGPADVARFSNPIDVAVDDTGNIFVVDQGNHCIRKITPGGMVSSYAGHCTMPGYRDDSNKDSALFTFPSAVIIGQNGELYVADQFNSRVRKISSSGVTTVDTHDSLWNPRGLLATKNGLLYITDNNRILRNTSVSASTFAGSSNYNDNGYANGVGQSARFDNLKDIIFDPNDSDVIYVADMDNQVLRKIVSCSPYSPKINASKTSFCLGDSAVLSVSGVFSGYSWSNGDTTSSIIVKKSGNYSVTVVNANGCPGTSAPVSITATPLHLNVTPDGPLTFCYGDSVILVADAGLDKYKWFRDDTLIKQGTQGEAQSLTVTSGGDYHLEGMLGSCTGSSSHFMVVVGSAIVPEISILGDTIICPGDSVMLETKEVYTVYQWKRNDTVAGTARRIVIKNAGIYVVMVTQTSGCSGTSLPVKINHYPNPVKPVIDVNDTILTSSVAVTYQWYKDGQKVGGATDQVFHAARNAVYKVQTTDTNGCKAFSDPVNIGNVSVFNRDGGFEFKLYPNPGNGMLRLRVNQDVGNICLRITNIYGAEVYKWSGSLDANSERNIDLTFLNMGIYYAILSIGSSENVVKIVIKGI